MSLSLTGTSITLSIAAMPKAMPASSHSHDQVSASHPLSQASYKDEMHWALKTIDVMHYALTRAAA